MNKEERILKYINSADELVFNGKRYYENDFYNDVENLVKENQKYKEVIDNALSILRNELYKSRCRCDACNDYFIENLIKLLEQKEVE